MPRQQYFAEQSTRLNVDSDKLADVQKRLRPLFSFVTRIKRLRLASIVSSLTRVPAAAIVHINEARLAPTTSKRPYSNANVRIQPKYPLWHVGVKGHLRVFTFTSEKWFV